MRNCVRCGVHVSEDRALRCPRCRERVNEEFRGEANRPLDYYFKWHNKRRKHEDKKMGEMLKRA